MHHVAPIIVNNVCKLAFFSEASNSVIADRKLNLCVACKDTYDNELIPKGYTVYTDFILRYVVVVLFQLVTSSPV